MTAAGPHPRILVIEHDDSAPVARLGDWLREAGADVVVVRPDRGDRLPDPAGPDTPSGSTPDSPSSAVPSSAVPGSAGPGRPTVGAPTGSALSDWDAVVCMGGPMNAADDVTAPWLPATRALLAGAVRDRIPTLGVCLGAQLLALATGGSVDPGLDGPETGAHLAAKRDAANTDPLFGPLPMTPDVMHFHDDVVSDLPPGAVLLMSSTGYPHQAYRVGPAAWGVQFHIETTAAGVREWARAVGQAPTRRFGDVLDEAEGAMAEVWSAFAARFVDLAAGRGDGPAGRRIDLTVAPR